MSTNAIYIYIGSGTPTILNVDNDTDGTALEQLGAIKMPEAMAADIFGDNIKYADNTTCIITDNPDNPAFPFAVNFDSSKIPAKPKRNTGVLAGMGLPSDKFIDIPPSNDFNYTAPANGFVAASISNNYARTPIYLHNLTIDLRVINERRGDTSQEDAYIPARKNDVVRVHVLPISGTSVTWVYSRFYFAEGEL